MSIPTASCLILGGTGAVGKCVVRDTLASNAFNRVLALGRRPVPLDDSFTNTSVLEQKTVDFDNINSTFPASDLPQVVFCSLATTRAAAGSAAAFKKIDQEYVVSSARFIHEHAPKDPETGLSKVHFLYCSSAGANSKSYFLYPKSKGETEEALSEIGFERVTILHPAFLKVVEPRSGRGGGGEWIANKMVPVMEFISERSTTISVAVVAQAMRLIGTNPTPEVEGVKPKHVIVNPKSKTTVAWYTNGDLQDIVKNHQAKL
ncbi:oxidoreductase [Entomortierella parvispora]|uniref:Oxidoreductase n=1 Tax=Entomortierella parvispora TaxID=205924 RepID=A0A9P3LXQ1_9FUNG|nr:oxidoreductase [Entomortierella parvispora]